MNRKCLVSQGQSLYSAKENINCQDKFEEKIEKLSTKLGKNTCKIWTKLNENHSSRSGGQWWAAFALNDQRLAFVSPYQWLRRGRVRRSDWSEDSRGRQSSQMCVRY